MSPPLVPRHSWLGRAVWVCVLGLGFQLRPATPGWGVGVCVCLCACSVYTPSLLAGLRGVGLCAWARVSAAPRHPYLGCCAVCVFVCALRLYPATPGWDVRCGCVCLGSGVGCAPPLLAWVLGCVCASVRAPLVPRHYWLGCAVSVCVFGLGLRLRPATPGWGVGVCVCWCAHSTCAPPLLARVWGVCVCVWPRVLAAPCKSWLGCWRLCVFVCALRLYPATPGWGVPCGCVCLVLGFSCAPPVLAGVLGDNIYEVAPPYLPPLPAPPLPPPTPPSTPPPTPPLPNGAVTRVVCPPGPPVYEDSSTATQAPSPGRLQGRAALSAPWSPSSCSPLVPWAEGPVQNSTPVPLAVTGCGPPQSRAKGARPRASCSRQAACSMSMTRRRRVQIDYSPGGLSVRLPWPPCRRLEHQASHSPPHASRPPPPHTR